MIGTSGRLADLIEQQDHVLRVASALEFMTREAVRWQVSSGRWQQPCPGVIVAHSGPITEEQRLWTTVLAAGRSAVLAGLTAARLDGLRGFDNAPVHVLLPAGRPRTRRFLRWPVVVHYSTALGPEDVHPVKRPPRTRVARSLVDAAAWMATDRGTRAILAAGVQQRLVPVTQLAAVVAANSRLRRRRLISETLGDIAGGSMALSELDFTRLVIRAHGLPEPDRQRRRMDARGRNRYLDAVWEEPRLVVEIDGAQHAGAREYWDDMERDMDLGLDGYLVLRFPAWVIRENPGYVAAKIRQALSTGTSVTDMLSTEAVET